MQGAHARAGLRHLDVGRRAAISRLAVSTDEHLTEINRAARQAGHIVTEQIDSIIQRAEQEAETIRREAERDAEDIRREAVVSAKRLLDRLRALEFPLGELVVSIRDEVEQVSRELGKGEYVDSQAISLPPGPEGAQAGSGEDELASEGEVESAADADRPTNQPPPQATVPQPAPRTVFQQAGPPEASQPPPPPETSQPEPDPSGSQPVAAAGPEPAAPAEDGEKVGWRSRRLRRSKQPKGTFLTSEGHCAVCHRTFMAGSGEALETSEWRISGDVGLCPDCQTDGWQLPDGARLPVRPGRG